MAVPQMPTGFGVSEQYPTPTVKTVTFVLDPPQGMGPELSGDFYWIFIVPRPQSHDILSMVEFPLNVTLDYNTLYDVNITAVNCAGESETLSMPLSEYSKLLARCKLLLINIFLYSRLW